MKKIISFILLLCVLASMSAITVSADEGPNLIDENTTVVANGIHTDTSTTWEAINVFNEERDADGNYIYAWNGNQEDWELYPALLTIDLQQDRTFNRLMVIERRGRTGDAFIDVSSDGNEWTRVWQGDGLGGSRGDETDNAYGLANQNRHNIDFDTVFARYIRMTMYSFWGQGAPPSIWKIELYNVGGADLSPVAEVVEEPAAAEIAAPVPTAAAPAPQTNDNIIIVVSASAIILAAAAIVRRRVSVKNK